MPEHNVTATVLVLPPTTTGTAYDASMQLYCSRNEQPSCCDTIRVKSLVTTNGIRLNKCLVYTEKGKKKRNNLPLIIASHSYTISQVRFRFCCLNVMWKIAYSIRPLIHFRVENQLHSIIEFSLSPKNKRLA